MRFIHRIDPSPVATTAAPAAAPAPHRAAATIALACLGAFLAQLGFLGVITTVGTVGADLHADAAGRTWILSSYSLGLSVLVLAAGSLADDRGRKRVLTGGFALLAAGAVLSGASPDTAVMVVGRLVLGIASAALMSVSLGLIGHVHPTGHARARATSLWSASLALGVAVAPAAGALLSAAGQWRALWWITAAVAVVATAACARWLEESRSDRPQRLDPPGIATLGGGLGLLVAALIEGRTGWGSPLVIGLFTGAGVLLAAFLLVEHHVREPMLDLRLFRSPLFAVATAGGLVQGFAVLAVVGYLPTMFRAVLGLDDLGVTGLYEVCGVLLIAVSLTLSRVGLRIDRSLLLAVGMLVTAGGMAAMLTLSAGAGWAVLVPGLAVTGVGTGLSNTALAGLSVASVPAGRGSVGSGVNTTARYVGSGVGTAIAAAVASVGHAAGPRTPALAAHAADGSRHAILLATVLALLGTLIGVAGWLHGRRATATAEAEAAARSTPLPASAPVDAA